MPNFDSSNKGTWFYFDDDKTELGGVCLRELSTEESIRINKITVKHRKKIMGGIVVDDPKEDTDASHQLTWDYCITDWAKVELDDKLLECTSVNKSTMMKVNDFTKFILQCLRELNENNKAIQEARLKNLKSLSSGKPKSQDVKIAVEHTSESVERPRVLDAT